jgi:hypothetical protein
MNMRLPSTARRGEIVPCEVGSLCKMARARGRTSAETSNQGSRPRRREAASCEGLWKACLLFASDLGKQIAVRVSP